ncbi:MAG: hypothetical protein IKI56_01090 [Ruminococcus sp.]|nr:hypothetical protein [Ruminococcus sp.]
MKTKIIKALCIAGLAASLPVNALTSSAAYSEMSPFITTSVVSAETGEEAEEPQFTVTTNCISGEDSTDYEYTVAIDIQNENEGQISVSGDAEYYDLTDEEQAEIDELYRQIEKILSEICPEGTEMSFEEYNAEYEKRAQELEALYERLNEISGHAGPWVEIFFDSDYTDDTDYGDLTDEEIAELNSLYDQLADIYTTAFPDNTAEYSDEEYSAFYEEHQEELDRINDRLFELEEKAGWHDVYNFSGAVINDEFTDVYNFDDEIIENALTAEEFAEYQQIIDRLSEIDALVIGDNYDLSDEEIEAGYAEYQDEVDQLTDRLAELFQKIYPDAEFSICTSCSDEEDTKNIMLASSTASSIV